mmetsp:Transcript_6794/g.19608  ORF Transcript_6794/g.19608 Transcript_6794/m.19608 type:complete len:251 (-) Transcript_6794:257-1009(-)
MPAVRLHHRQPRALGMFADDGAHLAVPHPRLDCRQGLHHALIGRGNKFPGPLIGIPHQVRLVQVAMVALVVCRYVHVYDISFLERALVGDAVANDLVDGGAHGLGEVPVVQRRRVSARCHCRLVHHTVNLVGGHTGAHSGMSSIQNAARHQACRANAVQRLPTVNGHAVLHAAVYLLSGLSVCRPVRMRDACWDLAGGPNAVRAQIPRPVKGRHGFGAPATTLCAIHPVRPRCLDVTSLVLCPRLLEAVL